MADPSPIELTDEDHRIARQRVAQPERTLLPVALSGKHLVWMRGFAVAQPFAAAAGREAIAIEEVPL